MPSTVFTSRGEAFLRERIGSLTQEDLEQLARTLSAWRQPPRFVHVDVLPQFYDSLTGNQVDQPPQQPEVSMQSYTKFKYTDFEVPTLVDPANPMSSVVNGVQINNHKYLVCIKVGRTDYDYVQRRERDPMRTMPIGEWVGYTEGRLPCGRYAVRLLAHVAQWKYMVPGSSPGRDPRASFFAVKRGRITVLNPNRAAPGVDRRSFGGSVIARHVHNMSLGAWALECANKNYYARLRQRYISRVPERLPVSRYAYPRTKFVAGPSEYEAGFNAIHKNGDYRNEAETSLLIMQLRGRVTDFVVKRTITQLNLAVASFKEGRLDDGGFRACLSNLFTSVFGVSCVPRQGDGPTTRIMRQGLTVAEVKRLPEHMRRAWDRFDPRYVVAQVSLRVRAYIERKFTDVFSLLDCGHVQINGKVSATVEVITGTTFSGSFRRELVCAECVADRLASGQYSYAATTARGDVRIVAGIHTYSLRHPFQHTLDSGLVVEVYRTMVRPEESIGGYHSSRNYFTRPFPHANGKKAYQGKDVMLGYELEFVRKTDSVNVETMADDMKRRLLPVSDIVAQANAGDRYAAFEYDGSVDYEMVTGYGPIDIHRAGVHALLDNAPFRGKLVSHDGGRCGLHVHLDKPTSVLHAARMTQFYHAEETAALLKAVARRYNTSNYARAVPNKMGDKLALRSLWSNARYGYRLHDLRSASIRRDVMRSAINRINADNRYEVLNFQPNRTVEVRAFRGSMVPSTVIACLEFAYMSYLFARDETEMTTAGFLRYISQPEHRSDTRYLREYLNNRGFSCWAPRPRPQVTEVVSGYDELEAA